MEYLIASIALLAILILGKLQFSLFLNVELAYSMEMYQMTQLNVYISIECGEENL